MTRSPGPGWWLSADGNWRPPEEHPDFRRSTNASAPADGTPRSGLARRPKLATRATHLGPGTRRSLTSYPPPSAVGATLLAERPTSSGPDEPVEAEHDSPPSAETALPTKTATSASEKLEPAGPVEPLGTAELLGPVERAEPPELPEPPEPLELLEPGTTPHSAELLDIAEPESEAPRRAPIDLPLDPEPALDDALDAQPDADLDSSSAADISSTLLPITVPGEADASRLLPVFDPDDADGSSTATTIDETDFWADVKQQANAVAPPDTGSADVARFDSAGEVVPPTQSPTPEPADIDFDDESDTKRGISVVSALVVFALAAAALAYYLYFVREPQEVATPPPAPAENSIFLRDVGDCVGTQPVELDQPLREIDPVPCTEPHTYEVYHVANSPDGPFDADTIGEFATRECVAALEELLGVAYQDSPYRFILINPSEASWAANDRSSLCLAFAPDTTLAAPLADLN